MKTFTLDMNCLIDVAQSRPDKASVLALRDAHLAGRANLAIVGIAASEKQRSGKYPNTFSAFQVELQASGLDCLEILKPIGYRDITYWDWCVWSGPAEHALERAIHSAMFPKSQFDLDDHIKLSAKTEKNARSEWRNEKCDVLALASHMMAGRDIFVTRDSDFNGAKALSGVGQIASPSNAAAMV